MYRSFFVILFIFLSFGQDYTPVPINFSLPILFKVIPYNRTIFHEKKNEITICIIYNSDLRKSRKQKKIISNKIKKIIDAKLRNRIVKIDFVDIYENTIDSILLQKKYDVVFAVELNKRNITSIGSISKKQSIMSFSTDPNDLKYGISISCFLQDDDRSKIVINYNSLKAENVNLHPQILKLAKLIK